MCLKALGLADLPIIVRGNLCVPAALQHADIVSLFLLCIFTSTHDSSCAEKLFFFKPFKEKSSRISIVDLFRRISGNDGSEYTFLQLGYPQTIFLRLPSAVLLHTISSSDRTTHYWQKMLDYHHSSLYWVESPVTF